MDLANGSRITDFDNFQYPLGQVLFPRDAIWIKPIPVFFQFWMDTYFGDLNEGTHVIADDVKIHGADEATHDQNLIQVLNQCRKIGLKLKGQGL